MNRNTNIVFINDRSSGHLPYALNQAKYVSPRSDIVLIGEGYSDKDIRVEPPHNLQSNNIQEFKKHYQHMSSNSEGFELFCWSRWFYMLEYMRHHQVQSVLHLDSDVLLYSSIEDIKKAYSDAILECGLSIPKQDFSSFRWYASGHISYWTIDLLAEFCEFSIKSFIDKKRIDLYKKKWNWHLSEQRPGGICDMTTLYLFWNENRSRIQNLSINHNGNVFDNNFNSSSNYEEGEYVTCGGKKKIRFVAHQPVGFTADKSNKSVRFHALHFQGGAKKYIRKFYTGKPFKGKMYLDLEGSLRSSKNKVKNIIKGITRC